MHGTENGWSEKAVGELPEIVPFLETRGQIQAELGNHTQAMSDLAACINRGKDSPGIQRTIEACSRTLRERRLLNNTQSKFAWRGRAVHTRRKLAGELA